MTVKALEVLLNGEKLYTVGMEDWRMLGATVTGHRISAEDIERIQAAHDQPMPGLGPEACEGLDLSAYVGVADADPNRPGGSSGQNYERHKLTVGDEVTIRVIETDQPDKPMPPHPGHPSGPVAFAMESSGDPEED